MGNVVIDMSMSLDGYIAAPDDTPLQGLGEDGMRSQLDVRRSNGVRAGCTATLSRTRAPWPWAARHDNSTRSGAARAHWATCRASWSPTGRPRAWTPSSRSSPTGSRVRLRRPRKSPARSGSGRWARTSTSSSSPRASWTRSDPPGQRPARRGSSAVRRAPAADRPRTGGTRRDRRRDASRVPRRPVASRRVEPGRIARRLLRDADPRGYVAVPDEGRATRRPSPCLCRMEPSLSPIRRGHQQNSRGHDSSWTTRPSTTLAIRRAPDSSSRRR